MGARVRLNEATVESLRACCRTRWGRIQTSGSAIRPERTCENLAPYWRKYSWRRGLGPNRRAGTSKEDMRKRGLIRRFGVIAAVWAVALASSRSTFGSEQCATCHPEAVRQYLLSGMGQSVSKPGPEHPAGVYRHGLSKTTFRTTPSDTGIVQEIERGGLSASYSVDYVIGSGNAAFGYLVRVGDAMFQAPVTYYTEHRRWGMAPGMERESHPDFGRPVTPECLWCHAGRAAHTPNSVNRYGDPPLGPEAISCDRCHGPERQHLVQPTASTIVNPASLPPRERDSVCEQCHLGGIIRTLHPGRTFGSFEPGQRLEDYWTVFVGKPRDPTGQDRFQVVSHVEQLALSRCAEESGDALWCGTCHNPHDVPSAPTAYFSNKCRQCHDGELPTEHPADTNNCISCHMPRRESHDSGHSAFTDHRISRFPLPQADPGPADELLPWKRGPGHLQLRNLGIAHVLYGQERGSADMVRAGLEQLRAVSSLGRTDTAALDALGTAKVLAGSPRSGKRTLLEAVGTRRVTALQYNALAAAEWALGDLAGAESALEEAIRMEPTLASSYRMLARVYRDLARPQEERSTWRRLLAERPRLLQVRKLAQQSDPGN